MQFEFLVQFTGLQYSGKFFETFYFNSQNFKTRVKVALVKI